MARRPDEPLVRDRLARCCNDLAWELANSPQPKCNLERALALIRRAMELDPDRSTFRNTLGVVQYRAGQYNEAIGTLEKNLAAGHGQSDAFDLFFLAMAHHRLGRRVAARSCFDRAMTWVREQKNLDKRHLDDLAAFRDEAEAALAGPPGDFPMDVFAPN